MKKGKNMKANNVCPFSEVLMSDTSVLRRCVSTKKPCNKKYAKWRPTSVLSRADKKALRPLLNKVAYRNLSPGDRLAIGQGMVLDFYPTCNLFHKLYRDSLGMTA